MFYIGTVECVDAAATNAVRQLIVYNGRPSGDSIFDWIKKKESLGRYDKSANPNGVTVYLEVGNEPNYVPNCGTFNAQSYHDRLSIVYSDLAINGSNPVHNVVYNVGGGDVRSNLTSSIMDWVYAQPQTFTGAYGLEPEASAFISLKGKARYLQGFSTTTVPAHTQDGVNYPATARLVNYRGLSFHAYDDVCSPNWANNDRVKRADDLVSDPYVRMVHLNEANVNQPKSTCANGTRSFTFMDLMAHFHPNRTKVPFVSFFYVAGAVNSTWPSYRIELELSCYVTRAGYIPSTDSCP